MEDYRKRSVMPDHCWDPDQQPLSPWPTDMLQTLAGKKRDTGTKATMKLALFWPYFLHFLKWDLSLTVTSKEKDKVGDALTHGYIYAHSRPPTGSQI